MDLGHGGAAIGLALPAEPFLMRAEIGDPRLDLGLEFVAQVEPRDLDRLWRFGDGPLRRARPRFVHRRGTLRAARSRRKRVPARRMVGVDRCRKRVGVATVLSASGFLPVTD